MSKSPSLRRIQADIRELALDPSDQYHASPLENDMFEWHFTIRGAKGTDFEGGVYHGRILLPPDYPFKPPHIMFLTPSGRFEVNTKVCLSFSAYHPELWQPAWGIRLILEALISFLPTPADGAIGALDWSAKERQRLAKKSVEWCCPCCGKITDLIPKPTTPKAKTEGESSTSPPRPNRFAKEIEQLQRLQQQEHRRNQEEKEKADSNTNPNTEDTSEKAEETLGDASHSSDQAPLVASENDEKVGAESNHSHTTETNTAIETSASTTPNSSSAHAVDPNQPLSDSERNAHISAPGETVVQPAKSDGVWWVVDPILQLIIVVLSGICYLLLRKVHALCADLRELDFP